MVQLATPTRKPISTPSTPIPASLTTSSSPPASDATSATSTRTNFPLDFPNRHALKTYSYPLNAQTQARGRSSYRQYPHTIPYSRSSYPIYKLRQGSRSESTTEILETRNICELKHRYGEKDKIVKEYLGDMSRVLIEPNDDKKDNTKVVAKREEVIPVPEDPPSRSGSEKESLTKISIFSSPSPLPSTEDETRIDSHRRIRRSLAPSPDSRFEMKDDISPNMEDHLSILAQKTQTQISRLKSEQCQQQQQHEIREGLMNVVSSRSLEMGREETETEDPKEDPTEDPNEDPAEESQPLDSAPGDTYQDRPSDGESETSTHTSLSSLPPTTNRDQLQNTTPTLAHPIRQSNNPPSDEDLLVETLGRSRNFAIFKRK